RSAKDYSPSRAGEVVRRLSGKTLKYKPAKRKKNPTMFAFKTWDEARKFAAGRRGKHKIWQFGKSWVVRPERNPSLAIVGAFGANPTEKNPMSKKKRNMKKPVKKNSHRAKKISSARNLKKNTAARPRPVETTSTKGRRNSMAKKRKGASRPRRNPGPATRGVALARSRGGKAYARGRRNPNVTGFISKTPWLEIGKVTAGVVLGTNLVRVIPQLVLGAKNVGTLGHAANIATAILLTSVGVGIDRTFGVAMGAGALGGYTNRIVQDAWDTVAPYAGVTGLGDRMFMGRIGSYSTQDSRYEQGWPIQTRQTLLPTPVAGLSNGSVFNGATSRWN
ncbi:MAG: hypothetical protein L0209_02865, partial [candidate division Zixibacteria bacterium]|nr:hypothetical protein [candidate division Zixibacteria bacterium]